MEEKDIRPEKYLKKYLELCRIDSDVFFRSCKREDIRCPACNDKNKEPQFDKWGFAYVLCNGCGTLYQTPRPVRTVFDEFYKTSPSSEYWAKVFFPAVAETRRTTLFRPKVKKILSLCQANELYPDILVDVGAGFGLFLEEWLRVRPEVKVSALEPNPELARIIREKGIPVIEQFAEEQGRSLISADLAVSFEVVEHVFDPLAFCLSIKKLIKDEGGILITGPTVDGFDIQALWEKSTSVSPPHHINFLSINGFEILMERAGFSDIQIITPGELDVNIVKNACAGDQGCDQQNRFFHHLLSRDERTLGAFQQFLKQNRLSSYCWVFARKRASAS